MVNKSMIRGGRNMAIAALLLPFIPVIAKSKASAQSPQERPSRVYAPPTIRGADLGRGMPKLRLTRTNYATHDLSTDSQDVALARMLWGEARGSSTDEMYAVAFSAINRASDGKRWNGEGSVKAVVHTPWQYSCFNKNDPNRAKLMNPQAHDAENWDRALSVARSALKGERSDLNRGQTHYVNLAHANPSWAGKLEKISFDDKDFDHSFRRER